MTNTSSHELQNLADAIQQETDPDQLVRLVRLLLDAFDRRTIEQEGRRNTTPLSPPSSQPP